MIHELLYNYVLLSGLLQSMDKLRFNKLCDNKRDTLSTDTINNTHRKKRSLTEGLHVLPDGQPHMLSVHNCSNSYTIQNQFDQTMQRKSSVLSISPRMLSRWVSRKISLQSDRAHIYFPTATCGPFGMPKYVHCVFVLWSFTGCILGQL